jgi:hypothetical protein
MLQETLSKSIIIKNIVLLSKFPAWNFEKFVNLQAVIKVKNSYLSPLNN